MFEYIPIEKQIVHAVAESQAAATVVKDWITAEEYKIITGDPYKE